MYCLDSKKEAQKSLDAGSVISFSIFCTWSEWNSYLKKNRLRILRFQFEHYNLKGPDLHWSNQRFTEIFESVSWKVLLAIPSTGSTD